MRKKLAVNDRIFVDMDGVLADMDPAFRAARKQFPYIRHPQSIPGIFLNLEPVVGAIDAVNSLRNSFDTWVLSAPSVRNPNSYVEKRLWIEKHFDYEFAKRLILCTDKSLVIGDYLIDDWVFGKGQDEFTGSFIHFGSKEYPDWASILSYFKL